MSPSPDGLLLLPSALDRSRSTPPEHFHSAYSTPRVELSHGVFATLLTKESIHSCARNPPVATVQLVGTFEAAVLAPTPDRRRGAVKAFGQFGYREIPSGRRLLGLAFVTRRELQEPVPR